MLTEITIKRFKNIQEITLPLERINVLIGSNNSGKSSILQAIQFAVSVAQTMKSLHGEWKRGTMKLSFPASQLVYTPLRDTASLVHNRIFGESYYGIEVMFLGTLPPPPTPQPGQQDVSPPQIPKTTVTMGKGRGQNIQCVVAGSEIGRLLEPLNTPFSVFVPGLAGIPNFEEHRSEVLVRKAAARGDANNVFRNVLWLLKQNTEQWNRFVADFRRIFPDRSIRVEFKPERDEHIDAEVGIGYNTLPIDAAGTGVLQAVQILAYINLYKPRLLILDEPDAHLHPNNQRRLARVVVELAEERDFQVILSTHSRHLLDELSGAARKHWIRDGKRVGDGSYGDLEILMDVGALDRGDLLKGGKIKCVVLTEDDEPDGVRALLSSSSFKMDEVEIWPYKGCSNRDTALALSRFVSDHAPAASVLIHRDRDYFTDDEVAEYRDAIGKSCKNTEVFITRGTDVESHFLNPSHIKYLVNASSEAELAGLIDKATALAREKSLKKFINTRIQLAHKRREQVDHAEVALKSQAMYDSSPERYRHGKVVLKQLRQLLHSELKHNPNPFVRSQHLADPELQKFAAKIWPAPVAATAAITSATR